MTDTDDLFELVKGERLVRAYCTECGGYIELDETETCPGGHPKPCYRDIQRAPVGAARVGSAMTPRRPAPLPVAADASGRPAWVLPASIGAVAIMICLVGLSFAAASLLKGISAGPSRPYPPYPSLQATSTVPPTEQQKRWALSLSAILALQNNDEYYTLSGAQGQAAFLEAVKGRLAGWGISNRQDLLTTLAWIESGGHRQGFDRKNGLAPGGKGIAAWDYGRYVALCRWGYAMGYLTEDEAWARIMPVARLMQATYSSWAEYGDNYVRGREFWSPGDSAAEAVRSDYTALLSYPETPWVQIPWGLDLGQPLAGD